MNMRDEGIVIHDDFLDPEDFNKVNSFFMGGEIPWWIGKVLYHDEQLSCEPQDNFQFVHIIYNRDIPIMKTYEVLHPIISNDKFRLLSLLLVKANQTMRTPEIVSHGMHIDCVHDNGEPVNCTTAIYYVNTNNGYTMFENGTKVESVANRLVVFPTEMFHSGTTCTDEPRRVVINFNYVQTSRPGLTYSNEGWGYQKFAQEIALQGE